MKFKEQNFTQAGAVLLASAIIVKIISALFKVPLSADYALGDLGFGYFSSVYDLYIPFYTLALSGFPVAIASMIADFTAEKNEQGTVKIFNISVKVLRILGIVGVIFFCAAALFILLFTSEKGMSYSFFAIAPAVIFCCIASVYRGYFEGRKNMFPTAVSNVIEALGKLLLGLTGAIAVMRVTDDPSLASAVALLGIAIGTVASAIYLKASFKKHGEINLLSDNKEASDKTLLRSFVALLIPVAIASLSVGITAFIDSITLSGALQYVIDNNTDGGDILLKDTLYSLNNNISAKEIPTLLYGIKGKAHTLFNLVPTLTAAFGISAVPLVAECFSKGDNSELKKNTDFCLKFSSCLSLPVAAGFIAIGQPIMELLYGEKSAVLGGKLLAVYGIAVIFGGLSVPTTAVLQGVKLQKAALFNIVLGVIFKLACSLILTRLPSINVYGAAIGTAGCFVVIFALNIICFIKRLKIVPNFKMFAVLPTVSAFFCGLTAFFLSNMLEGKMGTVLSIGGAAVVYLSLILIFKVVGKNDIKALVKI